MIRVSESDVRINRPDGSNAASERPFSFAVPSLQSSRPVAASIAKAVEELTAAATRAPSGEKARPAPAKTPVPASGARETTSGRRDATSKIVTVAVRRISEVERTASRFPSGDIAVAAAMPV